MFLASLMGNPPEDTEEATAAAVAAPTMPPSSLPRRGSLQLHVHPFIGLPSFTVYLEPSTLVADLKRSVFSYSGIPIEHQHLLNGHGSEPMVDDSTLEQCGCESGAEILLELPPSIVWCSPIPPPALFEHVGLFLQPAPQDLIRSVLGWPAQLRGRDAQGPQTLRAGDLIAVGEGYTFAHCWILAVHPPPPPKRGRRGAQHAGAQHGSYLQLLRRESGRVTEITFSEDTARILYDGLLDSAPLSSFQYVAGESAAAKQYLRGARAAESLWRDRNLRLVSLKAALSGGLAGGAGGLQALHQFDNQAEIVALWHYAVLLLSKPFVQRAAVLGDAKLLSVQLSELVTDEVLQAQVRALQLMAPPTPLVFYQEGWAAGASLTAPPTHQYCLRVYAWVRYRLDLHAVQFPAGTPHPSTNTS
jgi:hypothetical protein